MEIGTDPVGFLVLFLKELTESIRRTILLRTQKESMMVTSTTEISNSG